MASMPTIRGLLQTLARRYRLPDRKLADEASQWSHDFRDVPDERLREAVESWAGAKAPTAGDLRTKLGLVRETGKPSRPKGCGQCTVDGFRTVARHLRDERGRVSCEVAAAHCDCALGRWSGGSRKTYAELAASWNASPATIPGEVHVDPGPRQLVSPADRAAFIARADHRLATLAEFIDGAYRSPTTSHSPTTRSPSPSFDEAGPIY